MIKKTETNYCLKKNNTFGINVKCNTLHRVKSENDIFQVLNSNNFNKENFLILGGGSNILFTKNFDGSIIKNEIRGKKIIQECEESISVKVGAGENWHDLVLWSVKKNLSGLENLALIPGNVGAAPIQNIGAYGAEVKDVIVKVFAISVKDITQKQYLNKHCYFEYRDSIFKQKLKNKVIITHVIFKLSKKPKLNTTYSGIKEEIKKQNVEVTTKSIFNAVIKIRSEKLPDPKVIGNCGSFFKNPIISLKKFESIEKKFPEIINYKTKDGKIKIAAAWMIESCGWKGYRSGDAGVHSNQSLVLVNYGKSSGDEILDLSKEIIKSVKKKFDITLNPEVNII